MNSLTNPICSVGKMQKYLSELREKKILIPAHCHSNLKVKLIFMISECVMVFNWEAEGADTISKQIYFQIHTEFDTYLATR